MSIVRIGLGETKGFSDGYDAIFGVGRKGVTSAPAKKPAAKKAAPKAAAKKAAPAKKPAAKKKK